MTTVSGGCRVQLVPDGPLLVRGAASVIDGDGVAHEVTRPVVAVCACGLSQSTPWCDGTHKAPAIALRARERARAVPTQPDR